MSLLVVALSIIAFWQNESSLCHFYFFSYLIVKDDKTLEKYGLNAGTCCVIL